MVKTIKMVRHQNSPDFASMNKHVTIYQDIDCETEADVHGQASQTQSYELEIDMISDP